ncbi:MAG: histidine kinase, partial [Ilumatobacteraceae bacterium]
MSTWARLKALWERIGPRTRDVAFVLVSLLACVGNALAYRRDGLSTWLVPLCVGVAATAALWWRRRYPVPVTLLGIALFAAVHQPMVMAIGLFTLAIRRRDRVLVAMTMAVAVTFSIVSVVTGSDSWPTYTVLALLEAWFFTAAGAYVGARRDLVVSLRDRAVRAEDERELRAEQARFEERARIAREMHDVLAHKVSLIALHAGALEINPGAEAAQVQQTVGLIRTTAREALDDLREVLGVLRAGTGGEHELAPPPRADDVARLVEASRSAGVRTELVMLVDELPDAVARTAYRVVQEGLTNVHKHARGAASCVTVSGDEARGVTV